MGTAVSRFTAHNQRRKGQVVQQSLGNDDQVLFALQVSRLLQRLNQDAVKPLQRGDPGRFRQAFPAHPAHRRSPEEDDFPPQAFRPLGHRQQVKRITGDHKDEGVFRGEEIFQQHRFLI